MPFRDSGIVNNYRMLSVNFFSESCAWPLASLSDWRHHFSCQHDERSADAVIEPHAGLGDNATLRSDNLSIIVPQEGSGCGLYGGR